jgi:single-stranded DNA-specific DHH superfamily exonuclease
MSSARKRAIVEAAVPEIASEIAEALHRVADSFETLACVFAYGAAADMVETAGEQRQLAGVMFATARKRFGGVKYDGQKITEANIEELDAMWCKFFKIDPKKLPRR